jgi:hypothetical protein
LVSFRRAATGNIHRAVGQEFVLNVNETKHPKQLSTCLIADVLYFICLYSSFHKHIHVVLMCSSSPLPSFDVPKGIGLLCDPWKAKVDAVADQH